MERDRNVKYRSDTQDLIMVDDEKADETYDVGAIEVNNDPPITGLMESTSNVSAVSSGSGKSTSSKKRVTFSGLADSLMAKVDKMNINNNNNSNNDGNNDKPSKHKKSESEKIMNSEQAKEPINHKKPKKEDGFARARLLRIKKYKFDGVYFGGVDLKSSKRIKVPTQKSIRTRRRTYSADVGPRSPSSSPRPSSSRTPRSNSTHSKPAHQQSIARSHSARRIKNINSSTPKRNKLKKQSTPRKVRSSKKNIPSNINTASNIQYQQQQSPRPRGKTTPIKTKTSSKRGFVRKNGYNRPLPATPTRSRSRKKKNHHHNIKNRKHRSSSTALHRTITPMKMKGAKGMRGSNTIQRNSIKRSKTDKDDRPQNKSQIQPHIKKKIALEKSKSISAEDDETFLATISSEEDKASTPKRLSNNNNNNNTVGSGKYYDTKWKKNGHKSKHKNKGKKKKKSSNNNHDENTNNNNHKKKGYNNRNDKKQIYSMTDTEDSQNGNGNIFSSFWTEPPGLAVARSLDVTEVSPKSPSYGANFIVDGESPPPLPKSPSPDIVSNVNNNNNNNNNNNVSVITRDNIKMHNIHMHRPLGSNNFDGSHSVQLSYESKSSSRDSVYSNGYDDVGSVYSHTSQLSETWSEYGSVTETLDDYFEALSKLGKYASKGYMHVITTSGKGKNIDIKLKALHEACDKKCLLAVASGIRTENVETFLPYVDILMVSTCISHDFHLFDPRKMSKFKRVIDNYFEKL